MLNRLSESRVLRWGFVVVALVLCGAALVRYGAEVRRAAVDLDPLAVAASGLAALAAIWCSLGAWRSLLTDLGSPLPLAAGVRVFFLAQIGKYVPGSIWPFLAQVELGREHGVPRSRSATVGLLTVVVSLVCGLLMAAVTLPLASREAARDYWWALAAAPLLLLVLLPPVLNPVLERLLKLARRPGLSQPLSAAGVLRASAWSVAAWLLYGVHIAVLARALGATGGVGLYVAATGAFALAWSLGFVFVLAPAGIGVREVALAAVLAPMLATGPALLVVVASRLLLTVADLAWALVAVLLGRRHLALVPELSAAATARRTGSSAVEEEPTPRQ